MKNNRRYVLPRLVAVVVVILNSAPARSSAAGDVELLSILNPALKNVGRAARVYYAADCEAEKDVTFVVFPRLALQPPKGKTGIAAIREIFQSEPNVAVTRERSGIVRITIGSVSTAILKTRIPVLKLRQQDRWNALLVVHAIQMAPEVFAAERRLGVSEQPIFWDILHSTSTDEALPHLPAVMRNITMDEALDALVKAFKGVITYGICTPTHGGAFYLIKYYGSSY